MFSSNTSAVDLFKQNLLYFHLRNPVGRHSLLSMIHWFPDRIKADMIFLKCKNKCFFKHDFCDRCRPLPPLSVTDSAIPWVALSSCTATFLSSLKLQNKCFFEHDLCDRCRPLPPLSVTDSAIPWVALSSCTATFLSSLKLQNKCFFEHDLCDRCRPLPALHGASLCRRPFQLHGHLPFQS